MFRAGERSHLSMPHIVGTLEVGFPLFFPPPHMLGLQHWSPTHFAGCEKMALLLYRSQRAVSLLLACPKEKRPRERGRR